MMTPAERLNEVLRITGTNVKSLSERLGYNRPQGLYDVAAGRTKKISLDLCRKIITAFPVFNQAWLLTGEGDPVNAEPPKEESLTLSGDTLRVFLNMSNTISRQEENISRLTSIIDRITGGSAIPQKEGIAG